jgi:HPt (histidine-containing phosphotransfer) domain-containing protein
MVARLVDRYLIETPGQFSALRDSLSVRQGDQARQLAHTVKSNAATFGLRRLAHWLGEVERLSQAGEVGQAAQALAEAEAAQVQDWPALKAFRERLAGA